MKNPAKRVGFRILKEDRGSFVFVCFTVFVFAAGALSGGAIHATGGAASAAAVASAFVLFAPFHNGYDGKDGRRKDDRRKYEGDGKPRARQLGGLKLCARKKLLHCAFLKR